MPILNYSTTISSQKTVDIIQLMLIKAKAEAVLIEYNGLGTPSAISFRIKTEFGILTFRLPADVDRVYRVIADDTRIRYGLRNREQATRIAWRLVKDWLEVQLAMIEAGLVDLVQVFLAYAQNSDGTTIYEAMKQNRFKALLPPKN